MRWVLVLLLVGCVGGGMNEGTRRWPEHRKQGEAKFAELQKRTDELEAKLAELAKQLAEARAQLDRVSGSAASTP